MNKFNLFKFIKHLLVLLFRSWLFISSTINDQQSNKRIFNISGGDKNPADRDISTNHINELETML